MGVVGESDATAALRRRLASSGIEVGEPASSCATLVTLAPTEAALRAALDACVGGPVRDLAVLDLSPIEPATQRDLAASYRASGVSLFGGCLVPRYRDGTARATLYVDDDALQVPVLSAVLAALSDDVVPTGAGGRAKAIGLLDALLAGVNAAAAGEALALGRDAGLEVPALIGLLQKGSGATTVMAHPDTGGAAIARREALARVANAALRVDHSLLFGSVAIGIGAAP